MDGPLVGLVIVAALIFANGVFVATEFAYVAARRSRVEQRASAGSRAGRIVLRAMDALDRYIAASQLGITMASLALGFIQNRPINSNAARRRGITTIADSPRRAKAPRTVPATSLLKRPHGVVLASRAALSA